MTKIYNPYAILGLPVGSDIDVVRATYKALIKIYHPDIFKGDHKFGVERTAELNQAYNFLSDQTQKEKFDKDYFNRDDGVNKDSFEPDDENEEFDNAYATSQSHWQFACSYHPELVEIHNNLKGIDRNTANLFVFLVVDQQLYNDAEILAQNLEENFFTSKFGTDIEILSIAKYSLQMRYIDFAKQLNKALKILGEKSKEAIFLRLALDFPDVGTDVFKRIDRNDIVRKAVAFKKQREGNNSDKDWEKDYNKAIYSGDIGSMLRVLGSLNYDCHEYSNVSGHVTRPSTNLEPNPKPKNYKSSLELIELMHIERKFIRFLVGY